MNVVYDGESLKRLREERHLTQGEVAARSGVTQSSISRCEMGTVPGVKLLKRIAPALGVEFDELVAICFKDVPDGVDEVA